MSSLFKDIATYLIVLLGMALVLKAIEMQTGKVIILSYAALFGYAFFIFSKTHILTLFLADKLKIYIGQLYLAFSVYKLIFSFFYFYLLKMKTEYYTKPFLGIFMIIYFTLLIIEFLQYRKILN